MSEHKRDSQYQPDEIPSEIEVEIHAHYNISTYNWMAGRVQISDVDESGEDKIHLCSVPLKISIPPVADLKKKVIAALESEKSKREAEHYKKMMELQEKINSMLCLEYTPESEAV